MKSIFAAIRIFALATILCVACGPVAISSPTANDGCTRGNDFYDSGTARHHACAPPLGIHSDALLLVWVELAAILRKSAFAKKMDCRVKPGNDEGEIVPTILHRFEREPL